MLLVQFIYLGKPATDNQSKSKDLFDYIKYTIWKQTRLDWKYYEIWINTWGIIDHALSALICYARSQSLQSLLQQNNAIEWMFSTRVFKLIKRDKNHVVILIQIQSVIHNYFIQMYTPERWSKIWWLGMLSQQKAIRLHFSAGWKITEMGSFLKVSPRQIATVQRVSTKGTFIIWVK